MQAPQTDQPSGAVAPVPSPRAYLRRALRTRKRIALLCAGVVLFIIVSVFLARWLEVENVERDDDLTLIEAETRGDVKGMLDRLSGCAQSPSCRAVIEANARNARVLRKGSVKILQLESSTAYALAGTTGTTRLAWTVIGALPVVQCIEVRRTGNPISGVEVKLLSLSAPIQNEAEC